jgi:hypothetical protein
MLAFLSAEKTGEVIQSLEQSGITPIDFTPVVTPGGTPARVTYADGTSIDITPSATAGNSGIDTSAILDGRSSHFVVRNGYTTAIGLQTNPKAKLHFITLTIIDSQGNPLNVPPPAPVK